MQPFTSSIPRPQWTQKEGANSRKLELTPAPGGHHNPLVPGSSPGGPMLKLCSPAIFENGCSFRLAAFRQHNSFPPLRN